MVVPRPSLPPRLPASTPRPPPLPRITTPPSPTPQSYHVLFAARTHAFLCTPWPLQFQTLLRSCAWSLVKFNPGSSELEPPLVCLGTLFATHFYLIAMCLIRRHPAFLSCRGSSPHLPHLKTGFTRSSFQANFCRVRTRLLGSARVHGGALWFTHTQHGSAGTLRPTSR